MCSSPKPQKKTVYSAPGMPELEMEGKSVSFFEFWPTWIMYLPVVFQWLLSSIRYRSLTLPLIANPSLPLSGMVGVPKSTLLAQAGGECQKCILPWFTFTLSQAPLEQQLNDLLHNMAERGFCFPLVGKPDIGCRGAGVKLLKNKQQLRDCLSHYPEGSSLMLQQLSQWEPEVGVFFVRHPNQMQGKIISLALKYSPYVVGDGHSTLDQLLDNDPRAVNLKHLYESRHREHLNHVIPEGTPYKLVFSVSHCRGAIFRNAEEYITPGLTQRLNQLLAEIPQFYYGRLDIKFRDIDSLKSGNQLEIVEINTASSESLHIWDRNTSLGQAVKALLFQYRTLFEIGHQNRRLGHKPPALAELIKGWLRERQLVRMYPETD